MTQLLARLLAGSLVLSLPTCLAPGCGGEERRAAVERVPEPIGEHECGACGMIVREQPSPRGQVVHHDGTHVWLCSVADLVAYSAAPSPHGRVEARWIETLAADVDPAADETASRPWASVADAHYVLGVGRESVMGTPVLAFASEAEARAAAERLRGELAGWAEVERALGGAQ